MMAPVAIQQGTAAARNILRRIGGGEPLPFRYRDPGVMVILGRGDLSVPRSLPAPIAPLEFPAVGKEGPDPFMPHVGQLRMPVLTYRSSLNGSTTS